MITKTTKIHYVYGIINPIYHEVVYIGQSKNLNQRWDTHWNKPANTTLIGLKEHLIKHNRKFEFCILEQCDESNINEREKYWIETYKSPYLTNVVHNKTHSDLIKDNQALHTKNKALHKALDEVLEMKDAWKWVAQMRQQESQIVKLKSKITELKQRLK